MKIFQIGFNKCGTSTIHRYLRANGVKCVHWDDGRLAQRMFANLANGDNLMAGYEGFDAFTDMEYIDQVGTLLEGYKLFPYLAAQYPDAVFILNTRDREAWIRSRLAWRGDYAARHRAHVAQRSAHPACRQDQSARRAPNGIGITVASQSISQESRKGFLSAESSPTCLISSVSSCLSTIWTTSSMNFARSQAHADVLAPYTRLPS